MRLHLYFILILTLNYSFSQENFNFQTEFKLKPNGEYAVEHFSFNFLLDKGKLIQKDLDLGHEKNYFIKFYESSYSKDGSKFVVAWSSPCNQFTSKKRSIATPINDRNKIVQTSTEASDLVRLLQPSSVSCKPCVSSFGLVFFFFWAD